jgi:hypothetical protein
LCSSFSSILAQPLRCSARRLLVEKKAAEIEAAKQQEKDPELVAAQ